MPTVTVSYADPKSGETFETFFDVNRVAFEGIYIERLPNKLVYAVGEKFDLTGLVVKALYSDGSTRDVTAQCTCAPYDGEEVYTAGEVIAAVYYRGYEAQYSMTAMEPTSIYIAQSPDKTLYQAGETFDISGLVVMGEFQDGIDRDVTDLCTIVPKPGEIVYIIGETDTVVSYKESQAGIPVTVEEGDVIARGAMYNVTWWTLYATGLLYIYVNGDMPDFTYRADWYSHRESITNIILSDSVTSIGDRAFKYCANFANITLPNSITKIGAYSFEGCDGLQSIAIGNGVTSIGTSAFVHCISLVNIEIPDNVSSTGEYVFSNCSELLYAKIGNGISTIERSMFNNCRKLKEVAIGDGVSAIKRYAFSRCYELEDIYFAGTKAQWDAILIEPEYNDPLLSATIHYNSTGPS